MRQTLALLVFSLAFSLPVTSLYAACSCHSKRPEMVKMHDELALTGQTCFACHGPANKLKDKKMPSTPLEMRSEPLCVECHG